MPVVPVAMDAAEALDGAIAPSVEPNCLTNDANGMIAMSAGGDAGAGPSSGISGWKSVSADETTATPVTFNGTGFAPARGESRTVSPTPACSVAASCWSSTTPSPFSDP